MKTEKEIKVFLEELNKRSSLSPNMNYERSGAVGALEWVLDMKVSKPVIGHR